MANTVPPAPRQTITGVIKIPDMFAEDLKTKVRSIADATAILNDTEAQDISTVLNTLILSTLFLNASDFHIESGSKQAKIRLRIDGVLHDIALLPLSVYLKLISRFKLVSGIKLNIVDRPQDGRFSFKIGDQESVEARVATLPSEHGESLVLRVLNPQNLIALKDLGFRKDLLSLFAATLKKPHGMIVTTGPTGTGKTTTLYAFVKKIQKSEIKIVTIEDPIEYHLEGISQTQVNSAKGYDFASGLQAIMRQDPDVILVGEIRDKATAQMALQASLTGHLVFSTLHANDVAGTISRLISLGAKVINIATALNLIIGQRLVRKVCPRCASVTKANPEELQKIIRGLQGVKETIKPKIPQALPLAKATGCKHCNLTGYQGRSGIFEAVVVSDEMERFIVTSPSTSSLRKFAIKKGMVTMYQDGLLKVIERITTLEELERVATA